MTWNQELVDSAAAWAAECTWEHSNADFRNGAGENLYAGAGSPIEDSYNAAALGWYNEIDMYNFDDPGDLSKTTRGFVDIGHFTAMVWQETEELGCARQLCPPNDFSPFKDGDAASMDWAFVVCHYADAGNRLSAGDDEYKLFRQNVVPVLADAAPLSPIRSCSSDTVNLEITVTAVGATCDAADTLADAIEETAIALKVRTRTRGCFSTRVRLIFRCVAYPASQWLAGSLPRPRSMLVHSVAMAIAARDTSRRQCHSRRF